LVSESLTDPRVPGHVATLLAWLMTLGALAVVDAVYLDGIVHWAHAAAAFAALGLFLLGYQSIVLGGSLMARRWGGFLGLVVVVLAVTIPQGFSSLPEVEGDPLIVTPLHPSLAFRTEADMPQFIWPESFATTLIVSACLAALAGGFVLVRLGTLAGRVSRRSAEAGARRG